MILLNFHTSFSLTLIALALGGILLVWAKANNSAGTSLSKVIAYVVIIIATFNLLCFGADAVKNWRRIHPKHSPLSVIKKQMPMSPQKMMKEVKKTGKKLRPNRSR